jgi:large subunit ribosomal protein L23
MKPILTEKAVMMIESQNVLTFEVDKRISKDEIKKELEKTLSIKVDGVRTLIRGSKKFVYAKLNKKHPAMDVATKLGLM